MLIQLLLVVTLTFSEDMLYGKYLPNETGALYYREGFITQLMPKMTKVT